jgi:hypothetical protein
VNRLRKFFALQLSDQGLLMESVIRLAWTSLGLRVLPFSYWRPRLGTSAEGTTTLPGNSPPAERIAWAVGVAAGYVPGATCLVQALAAKSMLRRKGYPALVRIGVRAGEGSHLEAHAWLVLDGQVILGRSPGCPHVPLERPGGSGEIWHQPHSSST